jgi:hypothetical protein
MNIKLDLCPHCHNPLIDKETTYVVNGVLYCSDECGIANAIAHGYHPDEYQKLVEVTTPLDIGLMKNCMVPLFYRTLEDLNGIVAEDILIKVVDFRVFVLTKGGSRAMSHILFSAYKDFDVVLACYDRTKHTDKEIQCFIRRFKLDVRQSEEDFDAVELKAWKKHQPDFLDFEVPECGKSYIVDVDRNSVIVLTSSDWELKESQLALLGLIDDIITGQPTYERYDVAMKILETCANKCKEYLGDK